MGSFYTATLFPKELTQEVKDILKGRKFFICSQEDDYSLVTESKMDEQNDAEIEGFTRKLSFLTDKPVVSYMIHDSDVLWFVIYEKGNQVFILDNSDEYFDGGEFVLKEYADIPALFGIDANIWKTEVTKGQFAECVFADEFLMTLTRVLGLPDWIEGIGYMYLAEDKDFVSLLKMEDVQIEKSV